MVYIIQAHYNGENVLIGRSSNRDKTSYYSVKVPDSNNVLRMFSFWKKFEKRLKIYKDKTYAEKFVELLSKINPSFEDVVIVEITQDMLHPVYNGCPSCGSKRVLERSYQVYEQVYCLDTDKKECEWVNKIGMVEGSKDREYVCADCRFDLDVCDLSDYDFDRL